MCSSFPWLLSVFIYLSWVSPCSHVCKHALMPGTSNLWPAGCVQPRMAVNAVQHKTINLLKTFFFFFWFSVFVSVCVFKVQVQDSSSPSSVAQRRPKVKHPASLCYLILYSWPCTLQDFLNFFLPYTIHCPPFQRLMNPEIRLRVRHCLNCSTCINSFTPGIVTLGGKYKHCFHLKELSLNLLFFVFAGPVGIEEEARALDFTF